MDECLQVVVVEVEGHQVLKVQDGPFFGADFVAIIDDECLLSTIQHLSEFVQPLFFEVDLSPEFPG